MKPFTFSYDSMGTSWQITIWDDISESLKKNLQKKILEKTHTFDNFFSRFIQTSLIIDLSKKSGVFKVPRDLVQMLRIYQKFYRATDGIFTPLIGSMLVDMGYDDAYSLKPKKVIRAVDSFPDVIAIIDDETIKLEKPVLIDTGGLGKGYFVDVIMSFLEENGCRKFLVNGSGDMLYKTNDSGELAVGLEHPINSKKIIGKVLLSNKAMCGSGINRRKWGEFHHIVNPISKTCPNNILATWVIAGTTVMADGLATCLFLVKPEKLITHFTFDYLILNKDFSVNVSSNFPAELY